MEDSDILFDLEDVKNTLRGGERVLETMELVEDTKGNPGMRGRLLCTNLRLLWYSLLTPSFNLSIGWACVLTMNVQTVVLKIRSTTEALHLMSVAKNVRYEFIFTNLGTSHQNFSPLFDILRSYQSTSYYREMRLRSAIITAQRKLKLLKDEEIINQTSGVWNLSSDQGNLGTLITTNIRVIWYADVNETFNMSLPYLQIQAIELRNSKYGLALVVNCRESGGGYVLGFRIDPSDRLSEIYRELTSLYAVYTENPVFGVTYERSHKTASPQNNVDMAKIEELDESQLKEINHHFSMYIERSAGDTSTKPTPVYAPELGFAVEKPRDGLKLKDLFQVII